MKNSIVAGAADRAGSSACTFHPPVMRAGLQGAAALLLLASVCLAATAASAADGWKATHTLAFPVTKGHSLGHANSAAALSITVGLSIQNKSDFDALMKHITTYGDPQFGHSITHQQFVDLYSPTAQQAQAVADYLTASGFTNVRIAENRLLVSADGTVATVERAFNTRIERFQLSDRAGVANTRPAQIPASLSGIVESVVGLQTLDRPTATPKRAVLQHAGLPQTASVAGHYPQEFLPIYGATGTPTGASVAVGVIAQGDQTLTLSDLSTFATQQGLSLPPVSVVYTTGTVTSGGNAEWSIDTQDILGISGGFSKMIIYSDSDESESGLGLAFNQAVIDDVVTSINVSLSICEISAYNDGSMAAWDVIFQAAVAQGQTFYVSSGDNGSDSKCSTRRDPITGLDFPTSSPYVVSLGGTTLTSDGTSYVSELAWDGGGGGISQYEKAPSWQTSAITGDTSGFRVVPDMAMDADPNSGAIVVYNGASVQYGGTSLAAPLATGASLHLWSYFGTPTYFLAPLLYAYVPAYPLGAHDIKSGSNGAYTAGPGWDLVTGFGTWNVYCDIHSC